MIFLKYRFAAWTAGLAIFCASFSISYTQSLLGLSIFLGLIERFIAKRSRGSDRAAPDAATTIPDRVPAPFAIAIAIFSWLLLSILYHFAIGEGELRNFYKGEMADLFLMLFGLHVYHLRQDEKNRKILNALFLGFLAVLIISGLLALFLPHRPARWIYGKGFLSTSETRSPHLWGQLLSFTLYRPIGFMNTRLTYAGLLILVIPFLLLAKSTNRKWTTLGVAAGILSLGLLVFNGTRSAIIGLGVAGSLAAFIAAWDTFVSRRELKPSRFFGVAIFGIILTLTLTPFLTRWAAAGFSLRLTDASTLLMRQTDFQRPIIWTTARDIVSSSPVFGSGPGRFSKETATVRDRLALDAPSAWYYLQSSPTGHAHNDTLHLAAVGGIPAAFLFLALIFVITRAMSSAITGRQKEAASYLIGAFALLVGGIAQCYYQDDEVVVVFWYVIGSAWQSMQTVEQVDNRSDA